MALTSRWRLTEVRPGQWWAVDRVSGTALRLSDDAALRLWAAEDLLAVPLPAALALARARPHGGHFVDLRFTGLTVRYRSSRPELVTQVAGDFAGAHATLRCSPDVVVELEPGANLDRIHRSVTNERTGVRVRDVGASESEPAAADLPALPPLQHRHFSGHYTGIHAALLLTGDGAIVVCGARRAGKTTTAVTCARAGLAAVLTDELVLVHYSGAACGVALPIRERTGPDRVSYPLERPPDGARMVDVRHLVVLGGAPDGESRVARVNDTERALQLVAPHLRPLGGDLGIATENLLALLRGAEVWHWEMRAWPDLPGDVEAAASELITGHFAAERAGT
ncbi:MAG: hypothetical protein ACRDPT_10005 [Streptomycetales bacterium]